MRQLSKKSKKDCKYFFSSFISFDFKIYFSHFLQDVQQYQETVETVSYLYDTIRKDKGNERVVAKYILYKMYQKQPNLVTHVLRELLKIPLDQNTQTIEEWVSKITFLYLISVQGQKLAQSCQKHTVRSQLAPTVARLSSV